MSSSTTHGVAGIYVGRSLCFAPHWLCSDAVVLFDRNSGDYWVVSTVAAATLELLQSHGAMSFTDLESHLASLIPDADLQADLFSTLFSLADNRLVETSSRTSD